MGKRDEILDALRSQLGEDYYSMNYGVEEGFGGVGTHYVGRGFGCAELTSMGYNVVLDTRYVGSTWNFYGDALGDDEYNQGGGEFYFVDEPEPADIVCYINAGCDGSDYSDCGHVAVYVGDGMVIGARGIGKPTGGYYLNIGVQETTIELQSLGGGWRFIRCTRLDGEQREQEQKTEESEGKDMLACIISIDNDHSGYKKDMQVLWTPFGFEYIDHPDCLKVLDDISTYYTGKPMMRVHSGANYPWVERLAQVTIGDGKSTKGVVR